LFVYAVNDVNDVDDVNHVDMVFVSITANLNTPLVATNAAINKVPIDVASSTEDEEEENKEETPVPDWKKLDITEM
jgi:hypothetical protein